MKDVRRTTHDYTPEAFELVRRTLLHVATVLGSWIDQMTVIGGAVPSLLVPQDSVAHGFEPHSGTLDVDLGLDLTLLEGGGYASIAELLRQAGYRAEEIEEGRIRRQTWRSSPAIGPAVTVDFLIPRSARQPPGARLQNLDSDFAAVIADGLQLVERDRCKIRLAGRTLRGEQADRLLWVCGPASFVVLKARAIHLREKPKDAYDLHYILANIEGGIPSVAGSLAALLDDPDAQEAMAFLDSDFSGLDSIGPARAAFFVYGAASAESRDESDALRASAHAFVRRLLDGLA